MKDWHMLRERYLRDALPIRLGGLAANLRRMKSFAGQAANQAVVESLLEESKQFIEWTAVEAEWGTAAELVELQVQLARWQRNWGKVWTDPALREQMAAQSGEWSDRVLDLSGLLAG